MVYRAQIAPISTPNRVKLDQSMSFAKDIGLLTLYMVKFLQLTLLRGSQFWAQSKPDWQQMEQIRDFLISDHNLKICHIWYQSGLH